MSYSRTPLQKRSYHKNYYYGRSQQNSYGGSQYQQQYSKKRQPVCYVCNRDLYQDEIEFYPCNCKYQICQDCYYYYAEESDKKCPNCFRLYDVHKINEYLNKGQQTNHSTRSVRQVTQTIDNQSSSNMSSHSSKQSNSLTQQQQNTTHNNNNHNYSAQKSTLSKSISHQTRNSSDNNRQPTSYKPANLSQVRILQKHILYVIGISPQIAKEDILRRYEYFGQYGKIQQITINKENVFQSENQGLCFSAYVTFSLPAEASISILALDQFVYDGRLIRASFGRTKYCKFFLKESQCLNKDCPYQHTYCEDGEILSQDDMQKKQLFLQCQQLAFQLSQICQISEEDFKYQMKTYRDLNYPNQQLRSIMPSPESIFEKKSLFKQMQMKNVRSGAILRKQTVEPDQDQKDKNISQLQNQINNRPTLKGSQTVLSIIPTKDFDKPSSSAQNKIGQDFENKSVQRNPSIQTLGLNVQSAVFTPLQGESQKVKKRNNSSDERVKSETKLRMQNYELQLANSLRKHLGPGNNNISIRAEQLNSKETNPNSDLQTIGLFNEKKNSRFLSLKDEDGSDNQETNGIRETLVLSRRSSVAQTHHQKKGSNQSLIIESCLKFLNDDTDVVPQKREPLIQYKTNPPSEIFKGNTPAQSHLGGYDDDQMWNNTIFSNYEYNMFQRQFGTIDEKSYYSHQGYNNNMSRFNQTQGDTRNSMFNGAFFNNSNYQSFRLNNSNIFGQQPFNQQISAQMRQSYMNQQMDNSNLFGRKTTLAYNPTSSSIAGEGKNIQLARSPSQPRFSNPTLTPGINQFLINQKINLQQNPSLPLKNENNFNIQIQPKKSYPIQTPQSLNQNLSNRMHSISFDKHSYALNQQNLSLFDKQHETSKDLFYTKIFMQEGANSNNNALICSQSLFAYNYSQFDDDYNDDNGWHQSKNNANKLCEGKQFIPRTPVKSKRDFCKFSNEELDLYAGSMCDADNTTTKNSEPKNYYQEYLNIKDTLFNGQLFGLKRRNSLEQDREKLHPQQLQFTSPLKGVAYEEECEVNNQTNSQRAPGVKRSKSRSQQRKPSAELESLGIQHSHRQ